MINYIFRLLLTAVVVWLGATYIQGVSVDAYGTAIIVALVLGLLNTFVKPVLKLLSFPITILTLGLFLLVINVVIIYMADYFIEGFAVSGFFAPLIFSFVISIASSILNLIFD